jgi:hypothetical protein
MKKQLLLTLAIMLSFSGFVTAQTTHIVDNNANGIGDFDNIPAAITAASAGDVILLVPSPTSYGNISLNSTNGKQLTIAGGGANGVAGQYSIVDFIQLNGGSSGSTTLDGMIIGGLRTKGIDVRFVDDIEVKALHVEGDGTQESITSNGANITLINGQVRFDNSNNVTFEYTYLNNLVVSSVTGFAGYHIQAEEATANIALVLEISNTTNWILSNSILRDNTSGEFISIDENSTGLINNSIIRINEYAAAANSIMTFNQTGLNNNVIMGYSSSNDARYNENFVGGSYYQSNFYINYLNREGTVSGDWPVQVYNTPDADGNASYFGNETIFVDQNNYELAVNSILIDAGVGNDADGTTADLSIYGGLDPMPAQLPNEAIGISVVPTVTDLNISLPSAISGGQVIINVQGSSKRN